jgi:hypothetical protein
MPALAAESRLLRDRSWDQLGGRLESGSGGRGGFMSDSEEDLQAQDFARVRHRKRLHRQRPTKAEMQQITIAFPAALVADLDPTSAPLRFRRPETRGIPRVGRRPSDLWC